jgi:hypothetical protein
MKKWFKFFAEVVVCTAATTITCLSLLVILVAIS